MPLCGFVLNTWGWETVFYVSGALALSWCVTWWLLVFDTPDKHPRISREEKQYLQENLTEDRNEKVRENKKTPATFRLISCYCDTVFKVILFYLLYSPTFFVQNARCLFYQVTEHSSLTA
jgi:ACS family sodium-dependent inorganic phosphate cotransporter